MATRYFSFLNTDVEVEKIIIILLNVITCQRRRQKQRFYRGGKDHQRGSIEKDGNRQNNSATIEYKGITISRTSYVRHHSSTTNRRKDPVADQEIPG